jgi:DNA polymerase IIIc chi subunit
MTDFSLAYSGQKTVESNPNKQAHDLLDALLSLHNAESPVEVETGQVRPQKSNLLLVVSLSASADMATLESVETSLAQSLVDLGVEPDIATATDNIRIYAN